MQQSQVLGGVFPGFRHGVFTESAQDFQSPVQDETGKCPAVSRRAARRRARVGPLLRGFTVEEIGAAGAPSRTLHKLFGGTMRADGKIPAPARDGQALPAVFARLRTGFAGARNSCPQQWKETSAMGLFDGLGSVLTDVLQGKDVNLMAVATQVFENAGGLDGVLAQLHSAGLSEQVASWVGTGENIPVSAEQIQQALSSTQLQNLAKTFGVDLSEVPTLLAQYLPKAVDAATPNGTLPS
jgi:uncharacterized protein YidB (DUF937 family)